jgi:cbb3-type cytochrome oxidase cytochrome c subunit
MNYGPLIFLAAFFAMAGSWFGLVLTPQIQLGRLQQTNAVPSGPLYPTARPGLAQQGRDVYRANGCATCHSQQLGQTGTRFEVVLSDAGTNQSALVGALRTNNPALSETDITSLLAKLPQTVLRTNAKPEDSVLKSLTVGDAKASLAVLPLGPDIDRGWGRRRSVAEDFLFDSPVMLGSQRVGPDLADVGARLPDIKWHLLHLYYPRVSVTNSPMPLYGFLFETRKIKNSPSPDALALPANLPPKLQPAPGYEVVPKPEAVALAAYLVSLRADAPLFTAPYASAAAAPAASASTTNAAPTNAPAK